jgi:[ribosomal protein S5]-alanine N-acetyltransferase
MRRTAAIDTDRLRLRPYRPGDLDTLHRLWTDPQVRRYLWDDEVISRADAEAAMRATMACTAEHGFGHWAVCVAGAPELIGFCGFRFLAPPEVELLYGLAPAHWGKGLATEAARAMLHFGFTSAGFARVYAITEVANTASVAVMQRLGMQLEARFEEQGLERVRYVMTRDPAGAEAGSYGAERARTA